MSDSSKNKIKLYLIRHGMTAGNAEKRYMGRTDIDLCSEGIEKIRQNVDNGMYPEAEMLFASPMKRCLQTAKIIYPDMEPVIIENLKEMDFGDFEGKNYNDLRDNPVYQAFIDSNGELSFPNGEDKQSFSKRVMRGVSKALSTAAKNGATSAVCVIHGGTTMAVCASLGLAEYFDSIVGNGGLLEIDITYDLSRDCIISGVLA